MDIKKYYIDSSTPVSGTYGNLFSLKNRPHARLLYDKENNKMLIAVFLYTDENTLINDTPNVSESNGSINIKIETISQANSGRECIVQGIISYDISFNDLMSFECIYLNVENTDINLEKTQSITTLSTDPVPGYPPGILPK